MGPCSRQVTQCRGEVTRAEKEQAHGLEGGRRNNGFSQFSTCEDTAVLLALTSPTWERG